MSLRIFVIVTSTFSCSIFLNKFYYFIYLEKEFHNENMYLPFCFAAKQVITRMSQGVNNSRAGLLGLILIYFLNMHCKDEGQAERCYDSRP